MIAPPQAPNSAWLTALRIAVILAAVALSLFARIRVPLVVIPFIASSLANCVVTIRRDWKSGRLSLTPRQLFERARAGERFPRQTLGVAAAIASSIAAWHISMG